MNSKAFRLAVLASGRGSNLRALIQAQQRAAMPTCIVGVFSDRPACLAVSLAREHGIPTVALKATEFSSRLAFDESLFNQIEAVQPDLIVCAGYMRLISASVVQRFSGRIINIHPSLLPKYPGLDTHARALAGGETEHGASVHCVIPALDAGPVIAQARVAVKADDTSDSLARRVLQREHSLLVQCVKAMAEGTLAINGTHIYLGDSLLLSPMRLNEFDLLEESM